jgi:hypothetical protein
MSETVVPVTPEVVLVEWFNEHWYKVSKADQIHWLASVTTKLGIIDKPFLARWRGDIGNREADLKMNEAGQRGKRLHWARQTLLLGGAVVYDPWQTPVYTEEGLAKLKEQYTAGLVVLHTQDEMVQIWKIQRQLEILKPKVLMAEKTLYDLETRDAGTLDAAYFIAGGQYKIAGANPLELEQGIYIEDLKTGSSVDKSVWLQEAKYADMFEKRYGVQVKGGLVTHTSAQTKSGIKGLTTLFRPREKLLGQDLEAFYHASALWGRDHSEDEPETFEFPSLITLNGGH